jgi:hypothetical protein
MRSKAPTVSEAVGTRMSVRGFTDRPLEGALIRRVLETPCSGRAVELEAGDELVVIDPMGQQVSDLTAFSRADLAKYLSSGRSTLDRLRVEAVADYRNDRMFGGPVEQLQLQADRLPGRARVVSGSMGARRFPAQARVLTRRKPQVARLAVVVPGVFPCPMPRS